MALPGDVRNLKPEDGYMCDEHPDRVATHRLTGETDSFGSEYIYMCSECHQLHVENPPPPVEDHCEWCGKYDVVKPFRDFEEGHNGRVYHVCQCCIDKHNEKMHEYHIS